MWKVLYWCSQEQRFFLSTEIGVSLRESCMACDLSLFGLIEHPRSALAAGFERVITSSSSYVWVWAGSKFYLTCMDLCKARGTHHSVSLCYVVISLLIGSLVTRRSIGLVISGLVHQDPIYFGGFVVIVYSLINC